MAQKFHRDNVECRTDEVACSLKKTEIGTLPPPEFGAAIHHEFVASCAEREVRPATIRALMSQGMDFEKACSLYNPDLSMYFTYGGATLHFYDLCKTLKVNPVTALQCFDLEGMSIEEFVKYCGFDNEAKWANSIEVIANTNVKRLPRFVMDDGQEYTIPALSKQYKISKTVIENGLSTGKTIREILESAPPQQEPEPPSENSLHCEHEINGEKKKLSEWLAHYGIRVSTFRARRRKGISVEEALKTPVKKRKTACKYNLFCEVEELCREFEVAPDWVKSIMRKQGLTADEALNHAINFDAPEDAFCTMNGDMLTQVRQSKKLDTWDLAEKVRRLTGMGFTGTMVYAIEKGRRRVSIDEIESICGVLKVKPEKVLDVGDFMNQVRSHIELNKKVFLI